jgi:hypothetical protein
MKAWQPFHPQGKWCQIPLKTCFEKDKCSLSINAYAYFYATTFLDFNIKFRFITMTISKGIYKHYKNNLYEVLEIATHSETNEKLVVYRALYGEYGVWVRPLAMFTEEIELEGRKIKRFELVKEF